jgi:hypothetical protein
MSVHLSHRRFSQTLLHALGHTPPLAISPHVAPTCLDTQSPLSAHHPPILCCHRPTATATAARPPTAHSPAVATGSEDLGRRCLHTTVGGPRLPCLTRAVAPEPAVPRRSPRASPKPLHRSCRPPLHLTPGLRPIFFNTVNCHADCFSEYC